MLEDLRPLGNCGVCEGSRLVDAVRLPAFPLTGVYLSPGESVDFPLRLDLTLANCEECGHYQLREQVNPAQLYNADYSYRSSQSHLSQQAVQFVQQFVEHVSGKKYFECVLELGCNDLALLAAFQPYAKLRIGVDPIWIGQEVPEQDGLRILGGYIENTDLENELETPPDLILAMHTFEHIADPFSALARLATVSAPDGLIVLEVPDLATMHRNGRYDQVFPQHLHYFSKSSLIEMGRRAGCACVGYAYNERHWGGSVLVGFRRGEETTKDQDSGPSVDEFVDGYTRMRSRLSALRDNLCSLPFPILGYGAGQMLPSLAYNMDTDFRFLVGLIDDDEARQGRTIAGLDHIVESGQGRTWKEAGVLITAVDATRAILRKLLPEDPRALYLPFETL